MDRIPLEIYRLIISMIDDEENSLWEPNKDSSPSITADGEVSQSISFTEIESHTNSSRRYSSSLVESTINMQSQLQSRLATLRKLRPLTLTRKLCANIPRKCKREQLEKVPRTIANRFATLKTLRLCNKKLAVATAEFVFEEVVLHFTERSYAKLEAISQHAYRDYVRVLYIVPKAISGPLVPKTEFGQWLRGKRAVLDNTQIFYDGQNYPEPLIMPDSVKISRKAINFHYGEYSLLHAKQQKLFATAEGILQAAIARLLHLKRVESGLYSDWSCKRQDIPPNEFDPSSRRLWRFTKPVISPTDDIIDNVWKIGACQTNFDMDQGVMVLRAVARGRLTSGARIDVGPLFRDMSKMIMQIADPEEKAVVNMLMSGTKHFNFYFKMADLYAVQGKISYDEIVSFLQGMINLESLRFRSAWIDTEDQFDKAFGNSITWPHLTQLSVKNIDSRKFSGLAALIQRHKASLRRLTLYNIIYDDENRCNISADLRADALDKIRIWNRHRNVANAYGLADLNSPHVFSDGAWSPRLGSNLREEVVATIFPSFAHAQTGLLAEEDEPTWRAGSET